MPTCRLYLQRHPDADREAFYSYNGPAFRFQPASADAAHPREFRQAGIEAFGDKDAGEADARTLVLMLRALQQAGLPGWKLRIGDVALFDALLSAADMPERWRRRLRHQFWRPEAFRAELKRLSTQSGALGRRVSARTYRSARSRGRREAPKGWSPNTWSRAASSLIGVRTAAEIAEGLLAIAADAKAPPLKPDTAALIDAYVKTRAAGAASDGRRCASWSARRAPDSTRRSMPTSGAACCWRRAAST